MNLQETVTALENIKNEKFPEGILIAEDLGVHQFCDINSNCPKAIQLRRLITETGISLEELIEGFLSSQGSAPKLLIDLEEACPDINGKATISVGGNIIELDLTEHIKGECQKRFGELVRELERRQITVMNLGKNLHGVYMDAIRRAKRTVILPQLGYSLKELTTYRCMITRESKQYLFLFPLKYEPRWLYTREQRYALDPEDARELVRDCFLVIPVSGENKILRPYIIDEEGKKFEHYHGTAGDCWGHVKIPSNWDGKLRTLAELTYQLQASLATINLDSLMTRAPLDMISTVDLLERSTLLGTEGQPREFSLQTDQNTVEAALHRRGWGRRR